ncbi:MAG: BamA/TamA family outer membrane protein [Bacteroidetes bacterium]|nr:BamA/TamA family outer membrane protein [Bacteroidota bacterium]
MLFLSCWINLSAQVPVHGYEVGSLRFSGNATLGNDQLLNAMMTRETPWGIWKWIYNRFDKEILGGQKPEYFDPVIFSADYQKLKRIYQDNGFIHSSIDTNITIQHENKSVLIDIHINEGRRSLIDTVIYRGIDNVAPNVIDDINSNKLVESGKPYVKNQIEDESRRIVNSFANNGYVNVKRVSVEAYHYASTDNFTIVFNFNPGRRYVFGNISIEQDTASSHRINPDVIRRHLDFKEGEIYAEYKKLESERNINRLGVFEAAKIENAITDTSAENTSVPIRVFVRTRAFQELTPEIGINDENDAFNVLFGIGYSHRNFLGGARNFSTRLRLNLQSIEFKSLFDGNALQDSSLVSKIELTTKLIQPYFINNKTSFSAAFSAMLDKQTTYYNPSLSSRFGTQSQTGSHTMFFVDWNLQLSHPKKVATQEDTIIQALGFIKQFNSFVTLTLQRDKRNDIFYPSKGIFQSISIEEGGSFPRAFGGMLGLDLPYSQYVKTTLNGQWYFDPGEKQDLIWAVRAQAGGAFIYGNPPLKDIPLTQRFYSGGSGSVRGWRARSLGAMADSLRNLGGNAMLEGTIEARWNLLKNAGTFWFIDLEKISLVFFYDFGNLWTEPKKIRLNEIAMAFGLGFRYNTIAGPIRIDFGMKLYDPDAVLSRRWVTQKGFFPETVKNGILQLGIGHTF